MKNTLKQNTMKNTEIKKNYATAIKGEAVIGARIDLSAADVVAMEEIIYKPMQEMLKAKELLKQSGLDVWATPEGMTKEDLKAAQEQYARDNSYDSWYSLRSAANWRFSDIQEELITFFSKIRVQGVKHLESTLFTPVINEENE
jgi:hypothetical protein